MRWGGRTVLLLCAVAVVGAQEQIVPSIEVDEKVLKEAEGMFKSKLVSVDENSMTEAGMDTVDTVGVEGKVWDDEEKKDYGMTEEELEKWWPDKDKDSFTETEKSGESDIDAWKLDEAGKDETGGCSATPTAAEIKERNPGNKPTILALHGGGGTAGMMRSQLDQLAGELPAFHFEYAQGPGCGWFESHPNGKDFEEIAKNPTSRDFFDPSLKVLNTHVSAIKEAGSEFYGITGYSQGAAGAFTYLAFAEEENLPKVALLFDGSSDPSIHAGLMEQIRQTSNYDDVKTLIFGGAKDNHWYPTSVDFFKPFFKCSCKVVGSNTGHNIPSKKGDLPAFDAVVGFLSSPSVCATCPATRRSLLFGSAPAVCPAGTC